MKRKVCVCLLFALLLAALAGCGAKRVVHCDACGKAVGIEASSNITEEWTLFCAECEETLFGDDPVVRPVE